MVWRHWCKPYSSFLEYGQTYHEPIRLTHPDLIHQHQTAITRRYVSQFYCFSCDTYIEVHDGIGVLLVSHTADAADVQEFAMNRLIHIKAFQYGAEPQGTHTGKGNR